MQTHRARNAATLSARRRNVAAIGNVRSPATLVGSQEIRSKDGATFLPNKSFISRSKPELKRFCLIHFTRKSVGIAAPNHRLQNRPNGVFVVVGGQTDRHEEFP